MRLVSSAGDVVKGRCRATNQCAYCARLAAVETSEMLALDALHGEAPAIWGVFTTSSTSIDPADFYDHRRQLQRAVKRRWRAAEFAWVLEFTTGYGPRSGGKRRPHWNLMLKGVGPEHVDAVGALMKRVWCERTGGKPAAQYVGLIEHHGGLMRYLALHFLKESQAPPTGWRGHRFTATRGYLWVPAPEARAAAQESLRGKRRLHRALALGLAGEEAELAAELERAQQADTTWRLVITRNPTSLDQAGEHEHGCAARSARDAGRPRATEEPRRPAEDDERAPHGRAGPAGRRELPQDVVHEPERVEDEGTGLQEQAGRLQVSPMATVVIVGH